MTFPLVKPAGFNPLDPLGASQAEAIQQYLALATDSRRNPDNLPALNIQRFSGSFGNNVADLVWDPIAKRFVIVREVSGSTRIVTTPDFVSLTSEATTGEDHFFGGSDYSASHIVMVQNHNGDGLVLRGDTITGFSRASTNPGVQCGRPIYAWDIDTWVVAGASNQVFYSLDGADNWAGALTPPTATATGKHMTPATDGSRILLGSTAASTTAYSWSDDGDEWTDGTLPNAVEEVQLAYDPVGQRWVAAGMVPGGNSIRVFVSEDNGETFVLSGTHSGAILGNDLHSLSSERVMAIGFVSGVLLVGLATGRLLASTDYGATFTDVGPNMHVSTGYVDEKTRILSNPFGPNMYLTYGSPLTGGPSALLEDMFVSLRTGL